MRTGQVNIQSVIHQDIIQASGTVNLVAALEAELATLQAKVETYYQDEIVQRGDRDMMRNYRGYFGIQLGQSNA